MFRSEYLPTRDAWRVVYDVDAPGADKTPAEKSKIMTPDEYFQFIKEAMRVYDKETVELRAFTMPPKEFLRANMDFSKWTGSAAYLLPAGDYPVLTTSNGNAMISFPDTLWHISVTRGQVNTLSVFLLFEPLTDKAILYRLPFPNCYQNGHICLGGNRWAFSSFSDFSELVQKFFSAPHNGDLFQKAEYGGISFAELFPILKKEGLTKDRCIPIKEFGKLKSELEAFK